MNRIILFNTLSLLNLLFSSFFISIDFDGFVGRSKYYAIQGKLEFIRTDDQPPKATKSKV